MSMKTLSALSLLLLAAVPASYATDLLFPAGSVMSCTVADGKISSKTTAIGDPVLCTLNPVEKYGRSVFPYGSYLEGRFEDYKDPGHFVGKGWMELRFDKLIMGNRVVPISAKVVQTPNYRVDQEGKILGNGHATKDTVTWLIPVLWPLDLINLPRRGPSPVLKPETRLTLELMDDLGISDQYEVQPLEHRAALIERQQPEYAQQAAPVQQAYQPAPQQVIYQTFQPAPVQQAYQPPQQQQQTVVVQQPVYQPQPQPQVVYRYPPPPAYYYPPAYRYYYGPGY